MKTKSNHWPGFFKRFSKHGEWKFIKNNDDIPDDAVSSKVYECKCGEKFVLTQKQLSFHTSAYENKE